MERVGHWAECIRYSVDTSDFKFNTVIVLTLQMNYNMHIFHFVA